MTNHNILNSGKSFWLSMLLYAAAVTATFNIPNLGYVFVAASVLFLGATLLDFYRRRSQLNPIVFLGNVCNVLFATPVLLMMAMKDIDHHEVFAQLLGTVCIAGLIGALACSAMIKLHS